jgi:excisionase family DNA binding protein
MSACEGCGGRDYTCGRCGRYYVEFQPMLTVKQVATLLACSPDHVYDLISAGKLPVTDIGLRASKSRLKHEDVVAYIEAHTRTAKR